MAHLRAWLRTSGVKALAEKSGRVEAPSKTLHRQKIFEPHVAQVNVAPKMVQDRDLGNRVWRGERHHFETEGTGEAIRERGIELAFAVENTRGVFRTV
jgi:hypothetical protein